MCLRVPGMGTVVFAANTVKPEWQVPGLLSVIGGQVYDLISDLLAPEKPTDKSFDKLKTLLITLDHYEPNPIVIAEHFNFNQRNQHLGETVAEYVAELCRLATHCECGLYLSEALRDRFVYGIRNEGTQKRLLTEANLTLEKAIEVATSAVAAEKSAEQLRGAEQLRVGQVVSPSVSAPACSCCGGGHKDRNCCYRESICHNCNKKGHLARMCHAAHQTPNRQTSGRGRGQGRSWGRDGARWFQATTEGDCQVPSSIRAVEEPHNPPVCETLELNGVPVRMEVDTGVAVSLISQKTQQRFFPAQTLEKPSVRLTTYTTESISVVGMMQVQVKYRDYEGEHTLYIVQGKGPTLLGRDWLQHVQLDWRSLGVAHVSRKAGTLSEVLSHAAR